MGKYILLLVILLVSCKETTESSEEESNKIDATNAYEVEDIYNRKGEYLGTRLYYERHIYISKGRDSSWVHAEDCKDTDERSDN